MLASIRFMTAGSLVFIISKLVGFSLRITAKQLVNSIIAGVLFLSIGNGMFVWALKYIDSGFGALLSSMYPLFIILMMLVFQQKKLKIKTWIGVLLGMFGMFLLVNQKELSINPDFWLGVSLAFTAILSWSAGSIMVAKMDVPNNFFVSTAYQMTAAGIVLLLASFAFQETWTSPLYWPTNVQFSIIGLILFGSIAAFTSFNYLLKVVSTEKVSTSAYVNPVIALFLGWYFLDEQITTQSILAAIILLTGVYFINSSKNK